ncbi:hypothetical protein FRC20_002393 [Serendipita sp. 405]|nr:hypothetical protein FRC20_002393 [Serendipita sp. 405]
MSPIGQLASIRRRQDQASTVPSSPDPPESTDVVAPSSPGSSLAPTSSDNPVTPPVSISLSLNVSPSGSTESSAAPSETFGSSASSSEDSFSSSTIEPWSSPPSSFETPSSTASSTYFPPASSIPSYGQPDWVPSSTPPAPPSTYFPPTSYTPPPSSTYVPHTSTIISSVSSSYMSTPSVSTPVFTPPPSSSSSIESSMSTPSNSSPDGTGGPDTVPSTSSSSTPPPSSSSSTPDSSSSTPESSSSSSSSSSSDGTGGPDDVTPTTTTPRSTSTGVTSGSSSASPGDQDPSSSQTRTEYPITSHPMPDLPWTTLSTPVTLTMTDSAGSPVITVPEQFTTVVVITVSNGSFTTMTQVIANPPGVLNSGDRSTADFFKNRGAVAGVFVTVALALVAMVLFVVFALRRRRRRIQKQREAEAAAIEAAANANQRFGDDEDHPVVLRSVPSSRLGMRGRSPLMDEDEEEMGYAGGMKPVVSFGSANNPFIQPSFVPMPLSQHGHAYPSTPSRYDPVGRRSSSRTPSPVKTDPSASNHGGLRIPPSAYNPRPILKNGNGDSSGSASGSGSGGTLLPGNLHPTGSGGRNSNGREGGSRRSGSPAMSSMYPPEYEQFASVEDGSGGPGSSRVGLAYEPEPVHYDRQITAGLSLGYSQTSFGHPRTSEDQEEVDVRTPLTGGRIAGSSSMGAHGVRDEAEGAGRAMSVASRSVYSQDVSGEDYDGWDEDHRRLNQREDPRLDPLMRMRSGLLSAVSMGQTDHLDYMRRAVPTDQPPPPAGSAGSHSTH